MIFLIIFWCSFIALAYTYVLYPTVLRLVAWFSGTRDTHQFFNQDEELPAVSVLISVYNEERVIEQRIHNIYASNYPVDKIEIIVGSDGSTDQTNSKLERLQKIYSRLRVAAFDSRQGKPAVINRLVPLAQHPVLIFTDAKVLFSPQAIFQLVKHFKDERAGIVGGHIVNKRIRLHGISYQENLFMLNEMYIKYLEGRFWGTAMGAYGACYAVKKELVVPVPDGFAVEDFYITMAVMNQKKESILELNALCFENVSNNLKEEYYRKVRISAGNFQNLQAFNKQLWRWNPLSFCFISHKFLRWLGPVFIILLFVSNLFLFDYSGFYRWMLAFQAFMLVVPLIDFFLQLFRIDIVILRFVTHFYSMNLALLTGLVKFLKGVKTNVWEPTKREH